MTQFVSTDKNQETILYVLYPIHPANFSLELTSLTRVSSGSTGTPSQVASLHLVASPHSYLVTSLQTAHRFQENLLFTVQLVLFRHNFCGLSDSQTNLYFSNTILILTYTIFSVTKYNFQFGQILIIM